MTNAEKAKAVVYHINSLYQNALEKRIRSYADWQAQIAGYESVQNAQDRDPFDWRNPYNPDRARDTFNKDQKNELEWKEVIDYATNIFLSKIPEDNTEGNKL